MPSPTSPAVAALRDTYDHLGFVVLTNGLWLMCVLGSLGLWALLPLHIAGQAAGMILSAAFVAGPLTCALYGMCVGVALHRGDAYAVLRSGGLRWYLRAAGFSALNVAVGILVLLTVDFWLGTPSLALKCVGMLWGWLLLLWVLAQAYALPLLVTQDLTVRSCERVAVYLMLRYPRASLTIAAHAAALLGLAILPLRAGLTPLLGLSLLLIGLVLFTHSAFVHTRMTAWVLDLELAGRSGLAPEPDEVNGREE